MDAWARLNGPAPIPEEVIKMVPDYRGEFSEKLGMAVEKPDLGGRRSARYSMYVVNEIIEKVFLDEPGKYEVSGPEVMKAYLGSDHAGKEEL